MKSNIVLFCASLFAGCAALSACPHAATQSTNTPSPQKQDTGATAAVPELAHTPIPELERLVAQGDVNAHVELGSRYGLGKDVKQDYGKAIALLQFAADRNNPTAEFFIGTAYYHGAGLPKDETAAVLWTERAADQGLAIAQYWMGMYILTGTGGIAKSVPSGFHYIWASAVQGNTLAALCLGQLYNKSAEMDRNVKAAAYWYRRASIPTVNPQADYELALLLKNKEVEWQQGDPVPPQDEFAIQIQPAAAHP